MSTAKPDTYDSDESARRWNFWAAQAEARIQRIAITTALGECITLVGTRQRECIMVEIVDDGKDAIIIRVDASTPKNLRWSREKLEGSRARRGMSILELMRPDAARRHIAENRFSYAFRDLEKSPQLVSACCPATVLCGDGSDVQRAVYLVRTRAAPDLVYLVLADPGGEGEDAGKE